MSSDNDDLPFGLYERLITAGLKTRLLRFDSNTTHVVKEALDPAEAHATLARHVANVLSRALIAVPQEDRAAAQSRLTNQIVSLLAANPAGAGAQDDFVGIPPEELRAIQPIGKTPNPNREVVAPLAALSASDLLVNLHAGNLASRTRWPTRSHPPIPSTCCAPLCDGMD